MISGILEMDLRKVEGFRVYLEVETQNATKCGRQKMGSQREEI